MRWPPAEYQVLLARTQTVHRPVGPLAYDCVKVIVVRDGSAILFSEFGQKPVRPGDVILLGPNILCGSEPEGHITVTTIYADTDYVIDQAFWQHAGILHDRLDAPLFVKETFTEPAQIIRLGEHHTGLLMPWLDELVALSLDDAHARFHRMQALWFAVMDRIAPHIHVTDHRVSPSQRARSLPVHPRVRRFAPTRTEAAEVREALSSAIAEPWTLSDLAGMVLLSTKQLSRVFVDAYGKTPLAYLTMLRVEEMARLLRETDLTIEQAGRKVGWHSRNRASDAFRQATGMTPSHYRALRVTKNRHSA
ncbi:MAG: helix-turn-helix domain-containing protein [Brevibacterium sp.]